MPKTHHVIGHKLPWTPYPFHPRVYTLGFGHKFVDWTVGRPDHYGTYCIGLGTGGTGQAIWSDHFLEFFFFFFFFFSIKVCTHVQDIQ